MLSGPGALGDTLFPGHFQFLELRGLLSLAHDPTLCRDSLTAISSLLLLYCHVPFSSSVCVVRSPFASLLKQWWHWGLTQTIPISRSLLTSAKCTLWCKVTFMRIGIRLTFEALYSLYRLGYNVPSAQCQALLGGWVGPYGIWRQVWFFISWLTVIYTKTMNMHHKCTLEHWNPLYKETNYQTHFHSPDIVGANTFWVKYFLNLRKLFTMEFDACVSSNYGVWCHQLKELHPDALKTALTNRNNMWATLVIWNILAVTF